MTPTDFLKSLYDNPNDRAVIGAIVERSFDHFKHNPLQEMAFRANNPGVELDHFVDDGARWWNEVLAAYDPARGRSAISSSLVRSTCQAKHQMEAWRPCVERIYAHVAATEGDSVATRLLRGLL